MWNSRKRLDRTRPADIHDSSPSQKNDNWEGSHTGPSKLAGRPSNRNTVIIEQRTYEERQRDNKHLSTSARSMALSQPNLSDLRNYETSATNETAKYYKGTSPYGSQAYHITNGSDVASKQKKSIFQDIRRKFNTEKTTTYKAGKRDRTSSQEVFNKSVPKYYWDQSQDASKSLNVLPNPPLGTVTAIHTNSNGIAGPSDSDANRNGQRTSNVTTFNSEPRHTRVLHKTIGVQTDFTDQSTPGHPELVQKRPVGDRISHTESSANASMSKYSSRASIPMQYAPTKYEHEGEHKTLLNGTAGYPKHKSQDFDSNNMNTKENILSRKAFFEEQVYQPNRFNTLSRKNSRNVHSDVVSNRSNSTYQSQHNPYHTGNMSNTAPLSIAPNEPIYAVVTKHAPDQIKTSRPRKTEVFHTEPKDMPFVEKYPRSTGNINRSMGAQKEDRDYMTTQFDADKHGTSNSYSSMTRPDKIIQQTKDSSRKTERKKSFKDDLESTLRLRSNGRNIMRDYEVTNDFQDTNGSPTSMLRNQSKSRSTIRGVDDTEGWEPTQNVTYRDYYEPSLADSPTSIETTMTKKTKRTPSLGSQTQYHSNLEPVTSSQSNLSVAPSPPPPPPPSMTQAYSTAGRAQSNTRSTSKQSNTNRISKTLPNRGKMGSNSRPKTDTRSQLMEQIRNARPSQKNYVVGDDSSSEEEVLPPTGSTGIMSNTTKSSDSSLRPSARTSTGRPSKNAFDNSQETIGIPVPDYD